MTPPTLAVDFAVDGYIRVRPALVVAELTSQRFWRAIDHDLVLRAYHDRGDEGMRWYVSGPGSGMTGTAEVWLRPYRTGTLVHLFVRCTIESHRRRGWRRWRSRRVARRAEKRLRRALFETKDELENRFQRDRSRRDPLALPPPES